jgi:uncharacterized membrane protein
MKSTDEILRIAIAGLALSSLTATVATAAQDDKEQCAGIAKAGKNDCATSANACHGHATADQAPEAWIYLPKGTCDRIAGGRIVHTKDPTPKK